MRDELRPTGEVWRQGVAAAWPICLGYLPIGLAFGVLAAKGGFGPLAIGLMSLIVFAGSSQFIAVSMIDAGASATAVVFTTLMVNLRHLLMSSSLAVHLRGAGRLKLSLFAYGVTDESYAVNQVRFSGGDWDLDRALVLNQTANLAWFVGTVAGGVAGQLIPAGALGLDYALNAMFICLLVMQLGSRRKVMVALLSGALAVGLAPLLPGNLHVVAAAAAAAGAGVLVGRKGGSGR
jgi:4-azaleucine resistance transporter AzlC